ncbi:sulfatase-like hydrolase/transferase [Streptomyces mirabilis]|uniref:sulfatase-like hydrolase/transferase n=1 Tax=Streptomyces mirabilis TaxID=68239 RepID=UPI002252DEE6|nr:sulfatase-like hydrolase/transferase [Streptomyces mirabilis]MCX4436086.1 sulfatase-like hydrolase/transferase [Streptomyces mirabilis]
MSFNTSSRQLSKTDEAPEGVPSQEVTPLDSPEAGTPEAETAETETPETETAGASVPEAEAPEADAAEAEAPEVEVEVEVEAEAEADPEPEAAEAPEVPDVPEAKAPETETPEAQPSEATTSETETPEAENPGAETPEAEGPGAEASDVDAPEGAVTPRPRRWRRVWGGWREKYPVAARVLWWTTTAVALAVVVVALLMPTQADKVRVAAFVRLPVEAIFGAALLIVLPRRPRIAVAVLAGLGLGALTVVNFLDIGFNEYLGRGFNVVLDWSLFSDAQGYLQDTFGKGGALGIAALAVTLVIAVLALTTMSVIRLGNLAARNTETATRTTLVLAIVWVTCAALGVQYAPGIPIASEHTMQALQFKTEQVRRTLRDEAEFAKIAKKDDFADTPPDQLLTGLRGKDMMITFIESYGRSAIEDPVMAPGVDATLTAENKKLTDAGFAAKSGWLTSATYGGGSWLGHSTFMSGLWISNQQRYRTVTAGERLTLPGAFKKTGAWDTVGVMPGIQKAWPEQKFYGIDKLYDSHNLGYKGPKFSWSTMPDQYALTAFERLVHSKKHDKPLMSTIILTSSHQPWAPIPELVPQDQVGDGSIYNAIEKAGKKPGDIITDSAKSKQEYGKSIQYSVSSLINYLVKYGNKNTVLIFLGDHQPIARVSGNHASRDVPVSIVAKDPKVLDKIADWNWADGLQPQQDTPVWKMNDFRDRFLTAYGSTPAP